MHIHNYHSLEIANRIYEYIIDYVSIHIYPPSYEEIRNVIGLKSNTSIIQYLELLSNLNYISFIKNQSRSIRLLSYSIVPTVTFDLSLYKLSQIDISLYQYLVSYITTNCFSPSYEEIQSNLNYKSKSTIQSHLRHLESLGLIQIDNYPASRSIHLNYYKLESKKIP